MPELNRTVAQDIRIRRNPPLVIRDHRVDNFLFIFLRKIYLAEWYPERCRDPHRIEPVLAPRTLDEFRLPYLDEGADDVVPPFLQERRRNCRIYSAR